MERNTISARRTQRAEGETNVSATHSEFGDTSIHGVGVIQGGWSPSNANGREKGGIENAGRHDDENRLTNPLFSLSVDANHDRTTDWGI